MNATARTRAPIGAAAFFADKTEAPTLDRDFAHVIRGERSPAPRGMRRALLATTAVGLLVFSPSNGLLAQAVPQGTSDPAACVQNGATITCTGNLSGGVTAILQDGETLNIEDLNQPIAPAADADGVNVQSPATATIQVNVDSGAYGIVTAGEGDGIDIDGSIDMDVTATNAGDIEATGAAGSAITVDVIDGDIDLTTTGALTAGLDGVAVDTQYLGETNVVVSGDVVAGRDGVNIEVGTVSSVTLAGTGVAYLNHSGTIDAGEDAISVETVGDVDATVVSNGDIAAGADGVRVRQRIAEANIDITRNGLIDAGRNGDGDGIYAFLGRGGTLNIDATGDIVAGDSGIYAESDRDGTFTINQVGDVTGAEYGVFASIEQDGDIDIEVEGAVSGGFGGVRAFVRGQVSNGETDVSVTTVGDIASLGGDGIEIDINSANSGTIVATATVDSTGAITADASGIAVTTEQRGDVSITQFGDVTATRNNAVMAIVGEGTINIDVEGNLTAGLNGVYANTGGQDDVSVSVVGDIEAGLNGVYARSEGGDVSVDVAGNISSDFRGVNVRARRDFDNGGEGGDVNVTTVGDFAGAEYGINVLGYGGALTVTHTGDLTADDEDGTAINVFQANAPGEPGAVSVSVTGDASGGRGVRVATTNDSAIDVNVVGDVTATERDAVFVDVDGDGLITVNLTGDVTSAEDAVRIDRDGDGDVVLNVTGAIDSGETGIDIDIFGSGDVTVTSAGDIVADRTALSVRTADLSRGIVLDPDTPIAEGDVVITHVGNLTSSTGLFARAGSEDDGVVLGTGNVLVNTTGDITGEDYGVNLDAVNGDVTLTHTGAITSGRFGVEVSVEGDVAGDISLTTVGDVSAYAAAFNTFNRSGGDTTLLSTGDIVSEAGDGVNASSLSGDIRIVSIGDVSAGDDGIVGGVADRSYVYGGDPSGDPFSISIESVGDVTAGADGVSSIIYGGGSVAISQTGNVTAGADGISVYTTGVSNNTVAITDGVVQGGADGAGVRFDTPAGSASTLTTRGAVTLGSLGGDAVIGGYGDETVTNEGVLSTVGGAIDLGAGVNAFANLAGAVFNAGETMILGVGNALSNAGTFAPGGTGAIATTAVTGDFAQSGSGQLAVDVDLASGASDLTTATGAATLAGQVTPNFVNIGSDTTEATIFTAAAGVAADDLALAPLSPAVQAELLFPNETDVTLRTTIDFTAPGEGLDDDQTGLGETLNDIGGAGAGDLQPVLDALLNDIVDPAEFALALDQLSAEAFLTAGATAGFSSAAFSDGLFSCKVAGQQFAAIGEDQCVWFRADGGVFDFDGDEETNAFEASGFSISMGGQARIDDGLFLNGGIGYTQSSVDGSIGTFSDIDQIQAGLSLKYQSGPWLIAGAVSGGFANIDTDRTINIGAAPTQTLTSSQDVFFVTGQLRGAYLAEFGDWYAKPALDLAVTHIDGESFTESGGSAALSVDGLSETYLTIAPSIEVGTEFEQGDLTVRPFAKVGATHYVGNGMSVDASFANGPASVGTFSTQSDVADTFADFAAGVTVFDKAGTSVSVGYQGRVSSDATEHGAFLKLSIKF